MERIRCDFGEAPARRRAIDSRADLHDIVVLAGANAAAGLLFVVIRHRIDPADAPGLDGRVPDAQRGPVRVVRLAEIGVSLGYARHDPYVLNGAAFKHPAEMN